MAVHACRHLGTCVLAADKTGFSPEFVRRLRTSWCRGSYRDCARYIAASKLGEQRVPIDLFPAERERVAHLFSGV